MAGSVSSMYSPSAELITLCHSQVRLLQRSLRVDWCGVYLTQGETEQGLVPLVVSQNSGIYSPESHGFISLPQGEALFSSDNFSLPAVPMEAGKLSLRGSLEPPPFDAEKRLVLPLVYAEEMMGLLVIHRNDSQWNQEEMMQLEEIANSLGAACLLDQQRGWYRHAWEDQGQQYQWERQNWADLLHQLRNPLTALKTFSKLLLRRWQGDDKGQQVVEGIVRQGEHLQELLQTFEASQGNIQTSIPLLQGSVMPVLPSAGSTARLTLTSFPLDEVLHPILTAHQAIANEKNICFTSQLPEVSPMVIANQGALREVVNNLLNNALKYTPAGGVVTVCLTTEFSEENWVKLAIADTGYGIPPGDQEKIFERNYRGQQGEGPIPGTGLGLAIVKDLVEQMQGNIEVLSPNDLSSENKYPGSTFTLWLKMEAD